MVFRVSRCLRVVSAGAALLLTLHPSTAHTSGRSDELRDVTIDDLVTTNRIVDAKISPAGRQLLYEVRHTDLNQNRYWTELWVQDAALHATPRKVATSRPTLEARRTMRAEWSPDERTLTYVIDRDGHQRLWKQRLDANSEEPLIPTAAWNANGIPENRVRVRQHRWSPDGRLVAVLATVDEAPAGPERQTADDAGVEVDTYWPYWPDQPKAAVWLFDAALKTVWRATAADLDVRDFAWSPQSDRLALTVAPDPREYLASDIVILNVQTRKVVPLVTQPGGDNVVAWSPNGREIAFLSQEGKEDWFFGGSVGIVSATGGSPRYPFDSFQDMAGNAPITLQWEADSRGVLALVNYHFGRHLFRLPSSGGPAARITPEPLFARMVSMSSTTRELVAIVEDVVTPSEVYLTDSSWSRPMSVTNTNPAWAQLKKPLVETWQWRGRDQRFDVHGLLIKPPDYKPGRRYPTLVYLAGGPSMVRAGFGLDEEIYPYLAFAAHGYIVFVPNSRGRGGFGLDFRQVMPNESDHFPGPYADVMSGVDSLIAHGIADPEHLGLLGFSYGGGLAAFVLTKEHVFKAAAIHEGFPNKLREAIVAGGRANSIKILRDQRGFGLPWEPHQLRMLIEQSPILAIDKVTTPTLLEYGASGAARDDGAELFGALRQFDVPSILVVYPGTAHAIESPKQLKESFQRTLAWFNYWILGEGYSPLEPSRTAQPQAAAR
jgi:dipeptidyl aminopeptidase/acylaminoacyl peptidase